MTNQEENKRRIEEHCSAIRVAVFTDDLPPNQSCVSEPCVSSIEAACKDQKIHQRVTPTRITSEQIERGELSSSSCDALVFPGGLEQKMKWTLSVAAIQNIQNWRRESGGGLVGICAGAIFLCDQGRRGRHLVKGVELVQDEKFHQAGLQGLVTVQDSEEAPHWLSRCVNATKEGLTNGEESNRMLYFCGPVFRPKRQRKKNRSDDSSGRAAVWATYASDLAREELPKTQPSKADRQGGADWVCQACYQTHPKKKKACCGETRQEQSRQLKMMESLVGVMPGSAAIVGVEGNLDGQACRAVLFGPHPEMGGPCQERFLLETFAWVTANRKT